MRRLPLPTLLLLTLALALPASAAADDTVVAADPAAQSVTALGGHVVWVSGEFGSQTLMQTGASGTGPVQGAPTASSYRSVDLGLNANGELILNYVRCDTPHRCKVLRDDLRGHRVTYKHLIVHNCELGGAVSQWRTRVAYGLFCRRGKHADDARSGLYVKSGSAAPRRLPLPKDAAKFRVNAISSVDLRGTQVAAIASDVYEYAFSQTVGGKGMRSFFAAGSEGDTDADAPGLALQSARTFWTLNTTHHLDDPAEAGILRQEDDCLRIERLFSPPGVYELRATDIAIDNAKLLLLVPGVGIVRHDFAPGASPSC